MGFNYTPNRNLAKPEIGTPGADWAPEINSNFDKIDILGPKGGGNYTPNSIIFVGADGIFSQSNNLLWDNVNKQFKVNSSISWSYRKAITIDYTKVSGDQTNFPVLISITNTDLTKAQADGDDIVFTASDGTTKLDHEIEKFDGATGELVAWVKVPTLSSTANTVIYINYGNASASNQQNPTGVWDSNFKGVWHLDEISNTVYDSTSNANNGTPYNGVIQNAVGKINGADEFDGVDDYINHGVCSNLKFLSGNFTLSGWIYADANNATRTIVANYLDTNTGWFFGIYNGNIGYYTTAWKTGNPVSTAAWHFVAITVDGSGNYQFYIDGATAGNGTSALPVNNNQPFQIGAYNANGGFGRFDGKMDEVHASSVVRSVGWLTTEYNNQNNPGVGGFLVSIGAEESSSYSEGSIILFVGGSNNTVGIKTASPNSPFHIAGSIATAVATKTANYTLTPDDSIILADATTASFTITLPTAVGIAGRKYSFVKIDSSANTITIDGDGTETINGATTKVLSAQWARCEIISNNANWVIVGE